MTTSVTSNSYPQTIEPPKSPSISKAQDIYKNTISTSESRNVRCLLRSAACGGMTTLMTLVSWFCCPHGNLALMGLSSGQASLLLTVIGSTACEKSETTQG